MVNKIQFPSNQRTDAALTFFTLILFLFLSHFCSSSITLGIMRLIFIALIALVLSECVGQVIDLGDVWEIKCPQGCSCEIQSFGDLPLHRWVQVSKDQENIWSDIGFLGNVAAPLPNDLLKVAMCVVTENPDDLINKLPADIQVFTILESGTGESDILLGSTTFQRFHDLISLDIQGIDYKDLEGNDKKRPHGGIVLSIDALIPLGPKLLYLNIERVRLTSPSPANRSGANLVIKPMNEIIEDEESVTESTIKHGPGKGHRLIFLSQQNNGEKEDKEILPYDLYKQEMDGYRETTGLFTALGSLTHLRVYDCALKEISWHMFDGLSSLSYLSLERNDLKFIPEFCFYGTPNLRTLSLAHNELLTLKSVDLAGLLTLENLDLRENNLTFLSELSFPPFPALTTADLRENPLDSVFPSTFEIMNTTEKLYLGGSGSNLTLQKNSFLGLRKLKVLHLYNLRVPILERFILQGMPNLRELKMRGNVTTVDFDAFVDLSKLEDLDLSNCHLRHISMDAFYGLENVRRIDLSNNELEYIPPGLFSIQQQRKVLEILLSRNKLVSLPLDFFKMLRIPGKPPQVQSVRLDGNPWDCTCAFITWNPHLVGKDRETTPKCATPSRLRNWGVFYALRKGGLQCKRHRRQLRKPSLGKIYYEDNSIAS